MKNYFWRERECNCNTGKNIKLSYPCVRSDKSYFFEICQLVEYGSLLPIHSWMTEMHLANYLAVSSCSRHNLYQFFSGSDSCKVMNMY